MSSRTPYAPPGMAFAAGNSLTQDLNARIARQGMSPRQQELNRKWAFYKTQQYDTRSTTWDGHKVLSDVEREAAAFSQILPAGYWDPFQRFDEIPLSMRRPVAPYHLVRVVVNRFTGLLFSAKMHPQVHLVGAHESQAWLDALIKTARLWIRFALARTMGGAMGSVGMTFQFRNGRPFIEVHDPRWCTPTFIDRATGELQALEIRYQYPREEYDRSGNLEERWYWYRRVIDANSDIVYAPALVDEDGNEPDWIEERRVDHGLGEFPGVWIRNSQTDDIDGEADCEGEYDTQEAIDTLLSQGSQGAIENCDPTLAVASDELEQGQLKKGSFNGLKLEKGASASYVEMSGSGTTAAIEMFKVHRKNFLEVVQCVLESEEPTLTATEVERRYSSMHERGDLFREQYGEMGIKPLIGKMVRAAIALRKGRPHPVTGQIVVGQVFLAPVIDAAGKLQNVEIPANLEAFDDDHVEIKWPEWVKRGPSDAQAAAGAVSTARTARVIDQQNAIEYLAPYFQIEDVTKALEALEAEQQAQLDAMMGPEILAARQAIPSTDPTAGLTIPAEAPPPAQPAQPSPAPATPPSQPAQPVDAGTPAAESATGKAADVALNGAQVTAALEIASKVTTGEIAPDAATLMLVAFGLVADIAVARQIVEAQVRAKPPAASSPAPAPMPGAPVV